MEESYENLDRLKIDDANYPTKLTKKFKSREQYKPNEKNLLRAVIPGTIREIYVQPGDYVKMGDELLVLEAMKMRNKIKSSFNCMIKEIKVKTGDNVAKRDLLLTFEIE